MWGRSTAYGWVSLGITHDTAEFAVQSIRFWDYLGDRINVAGAVSVPQLPALIRPP